MQSIHKYKCTKCNQEFTQKYTNYDQKFKFKEKNYTQYRYMCLSANGYLMKHKYIDKNTIKFCLIAKLIFINLKNHLIAIYMYRRIKGEDLGNIYTCSSSLNTFQCQPQSCQVWTNTWNILPKCLPSLTSWLDLLNFFIANFAFFLTEFWVQ